MGDCRVIGARIGGVLHWQGHPVERVFVIQSGRDGKGRVRAGIDHEQDPQPVTLRALAL